jgi:hypothetical protein
VRYPNGMASVLSSNRRFADGAAVIGCGSPKPLTLARIKMTACDNQGRIPRQCVTKGCQGVNLQDTLRSCGGGNVGLWMSGDESLV